MTDNASDNNVRKIRPSPLDLEYIENRILDSTRSKLVSWVKIYSTVAGIIFISINAFGLSFLVSSSVDSAISRRAALISDSFGNITKSITEQMIVQLAEVQSKLPQLSDAVSSADERSSTLAARQNELETLISRLEEALSATDAKQLTALLEASLFNINSFSISSGFCFPDEEKLSLHEKLASAKFEPSIIFETPLKTGEGDVFFDDGETEKIELTDQDRTISSFSFLGEYCFVHRYVPAAPFKNLIAYRDSRHIPNINSITYSAGAFPEVFQDGGNAEEAANSAVMDSSSVITTLEMNGASKILLHRPTDNLQLDRYEITDSLNVFTFVMTLDQPLDISEEIRRRVELTPSSKPE